MDALDIKQIGFYDSLDALKDSISVHSYALKKLRKMCRNGGVWKKLVNEDFLAKYKALDGRENNAMYDAYTLWLVVQTYVRTRGLTIKAY